MGSCEFILITSYPFPTNPSTKSHKSSFHYPNFFPLLETVTKFSPPIVWSIWYKMRRREERLSQKTELRIYDIGMVIKKFY